MDQAGDIVLEGLIGRFAARLAGQQRLEIRDPLAVQATVQTGARDALMEDSRVTASRSSRGSSKD